MTDEEKAYKFFLWCKGVNDLQHGESLWKQEDKTMWIEGMKFYELYANSCLWLGNEQEQQH